MSLLRRKNQRKPAADERTKAKKRIENEKSTAILSGLGAVLGIILMFSFRAWLGGLVYLVGGYFGYIYLKDEFEKLRNVSVVDFLKQKLNGNIYNKIITVVVCLIPVIVVLAAIMWIFVDTARDVADIYDAASGIYIYIKENLWVCLILIRLRTV